MVNQGRIETWLALGIEDRSATERNSSDLVQPLRRLFPWSFHSPVHRCTKHSLRISLESFLFSSHGRDGIIITEILKYYKSTLKSLSITLVAGKWIGATVIGQDNKTSEQWHKGRRPQHKEGNHNARKETTTKWRKPKHKEEDHSTRSDATVYTRNETTTQGRK